MAMRWHDLLFAHWPFAPREVAALLPRGVELDTHAGSAWIGIVPFHMTRIRARVCPPLPGLSAFPEINVRTYVTCAGRPAVWFFSLDAAHRLAVCTARRVYHLPYFRAEMSVTATMDGGIAFRTRRIHRGAAPSEFVGRYRPTGEPFHAQPGTLEHWLTERYRLYATDRAGRVCSADIHHVPWPLQRAELDIERNTMLAQLGLTPPSAPPLLHFSRCIDAVAWKLRPLDRQP